MSYLDKCTEGEWVFDISRFNDSYCFDILSDVGDQLLVFASAENESDASLMAASKKMYEALDEVSSMLSMLMENSNIRMLVDDDRYDEAIEKANSALRSARGEK